MPDLATTNAQAVEHLLTVLDRVDLKIGTAESCTGGLLAALMTNVEGLSHVFERGFVVYCDEAKADMLGIDPVLLEQEGAVSAACAAAMVDGALERSRADVMVAITGYAGPTDDGGKEGQVFIAAGLRTGDHIVEEFRFGKSGRDTVRDAAVEAAVALTRQCLARHGQAVSPAQP